jgi:putative FmdB family regulatory protein
MPTYEYLCRDCGHRFETVQSMKDDALTVCPVCGGVLRKVFGAPMISFKGSGFYATDHGKKSKKPAEQKDGKQAGEPASTNAETSKSEPAGGSEKKSGDAAPAAKPASEISSGSNGSSKTGADGGGPAPTPKKEPTK